MNNKTSLKKRLIKYRDLIPFVIPAVLFALIFSYLPMTGIAIAFKDSPNFGGRGGVLYNFFKADWTLKNFAVLFSDKEILNVIKNTLIISVMKIVLLFPLPIILAIMISEITNKLFSKSIQGLVFLPHFLSWVVITGIFNSLLDIYGPINSLVRLFNKDPVFFMGEAKWFRWLVVILSGWKEIGYSSIVYISAIMAIDPQLYETAKIDGASKLEQIWYITIPGILPTIMAMFIIRIGYLMDAGFDQIQTMISANTRETGEIIGTYVYRLGFGEGSRDYGLSTAVGLFNGVISLTLILGSNYISKKRFGTGIW